MIDVPRCAEALSRPGRGWSCCCAQVRDPGNAGTVIRCADAFGADAVSDQPGLGRLYNAKTVRASTGSLFHLPIAVGVDLAEAVDASPRRRPAGARRRRSRRVHVSTSSRQSGELARTTLWVLGNEAWGLPAEHSHCCRPGWSPCRCTGGPRASTCPRPLPSCSDASATAQRS